MHDPSLKRLDIATLVALRAPAEEGLIEFFLANGIYNGVFLIFWKCQSVAISAIVSLGLLQRSFPFPDCRIRPAQISSVRFAQVDVTEHGAQRAWQIAQAFQCHGQSKISVVLISVGREVEQVLFLFEINKA
ncbi:MAG: hypothetical protein Q8Q81_02600 [Oxalobacteraceae bacterium]|nr:hypothetical protein [Oxalobacteraceae bacterium]